MTVLSSQCRNRTFSILASLLVDGLPCSTRSDPIFCVSKQQQIRKKMAENAGDAAAGRSKKRVRCEDVVVELDDIKETQQMILKQLSRLRSRRPSAEETFDSEEVEDSLEELPSLAKTLTALARSLAAGEGRPAKLRKVLLTLPPVERSLLVGFSQEVIVALPAASSASTELAQDDTEGFPSLHFAGDTTFSSLLDETSAPSFPSGPSFLADSQGAF